MSDAAFSSWRAAEFPQLQGAVYVDHAGATLYSKSQLQATTEELGGHLFGNPHSQSDGSTRSSTIIEAARSRVLSFFNTSSAEYTCIFTAGATGALKLLGEVFPWSSESEFCYTVENHNSALGIREYALEKGAVVCPVDFETSIGGDSEDDGGRKWSVKRREPLIRPQLKHDPPGSSIEHPPQDEVFHLFACPAECNFSGAKLNLSQVEEIQKGQWSGKRGHWKVLLDAAKACGTAPPDLSIHQPEFVAVSFYKIFGYPTGLGALLVRSDAGQILQKRYFSGGTVAVSIADKDYMRRRERLEEWLEDGTASFLGVAALRHGFDAVKKLGMDNIRKHTAALTQFTARELLSLRHSNGRKACVLYGNHAANDGQNQGPIIAFNLVRPDGSWVGYREVEKLAGLRDIQLRTGCFCNPGACAKYLGLTSTEMEANYEAGHVCWDDQDLIDGRPTGAIRISFGYMTTVEDARAVLRFVRDYFVVTEPEPLSERNGVAESRAKDTDCAREPMVLEKILLYPIKSCGGFAPDAWPIGPNGLLYDREWLLVDSGGNGLTQKKVPALCTLQASIDLEAGHLRVTSRAMQDALLVPLHSRPRATLDGTVQVCGDRPGADAYGPEISSWFSDALGIPCTLVRQQPRSRTVHRQTPHKLKQQSEIASPHHTSAAQTNENRKVNTTADEQLDSSLGFANEGQFLLVNTASVEELNRRMVETDGRSGDKKKGSRGLEVLEPERFRPNLVVRGLEPFEEDTWQQVRIAGQQFGVIGGCSRCSMITVDQKTGEKGGNEPLLALASFRRNKGKLLFGILLNHEPGRSQGDVENPKPGRGKGLGHRDWLRKRWPNVLRCGSELSASS
ncbi:molybdenum cofactor sulfurase [Klebsormidium nitens]|uniref:Molybdenum cofactor sulfurase n=1 Tax=Klebsormidium nitens TaxID=105231 RepID=A0A1Y1HVX6_KLENI|nr:molybdenum cofactor sulfurase [Klebsormidium nitens]|eukprot:GAQ81349.1 molybdenum cofactor sulfurase [Klebsormidium nitens]